MSLDKANSKMLVEIKKLHVPDDGPVAVVPNSIGELDLVNGGDDIAQPRPAASNPDPTTDQPPAESASNDGPAYDLC